MNVHAHFLRKHLGLRSSWLCAMWVFSACALNVQGESQDPDALLDARERIPGLDGDDGYDEEGAGAADGDDEGPPDPSRPLPGEPAPEDPLAPPPEAEPGAEVDAGAVSERDAGSPSGDELDAGVIVDDPGLEGDAGSMPFADAGQSGQADEDDERDEDDEDDESNRGSGNGNGNGSGKGNGNSDD